MTAPRMPTFAELDFALDDAAQVVELRAEIERLRVALRTIAENPFMDPEANAEFAREALEQ